VLLEASPCSLPVGPTCVYDGDMVCRQWTFFFLSSLFPKNYSLTLLVVGISIPILIILISNFVLILLHNFYLFSISSFNYNLSNIIFSNLIIILVIYSFLPLSFCMSFIGF
jgi:hypothetical protein